LRGTLLLLIFVIIAGSLCATDLYVGSGEEFQEIGAAIQAAENGDNIYVYEGYYQENLYIDKDIQIIGIDQPVLSGGMINSFQYWAVKFAGNITAGFSGFTIVNSRWGGIRVISEANVNISNNTITTESGAIDRPIEVNGAGDVVINDNVLSGATYNFIEIQPSPSQSVTIHENVFLNMGSSMLRNQQVEEIDARFNYWGSEHGPSHYTNPTGDGFFISDKVEYFPWYRDEELGSLMQFGDVIAGAIEIELSSGDFFDSQDTEAFHDYYSLPYGEDYKDIVYSFNIDENFNQLLNINIVEADFDTQIALYYNTNEPDYDNAVEYDTNADDMLSSLTDLSLNNGNYFLIVDGCSSAAAGTYQIEFVLGDEITPICEYGEITATYQLETDNVLIEWFTLSENDNSGWNIYRSEINNISTAQTINSELIPGSGNSNEIVNYDFTDELPVMEFCTYYYWLEVNDFSGNTVLSSVFQIQIPGNTNQEYFNFKEYLFGSISTLSLNVTEMDEYGNVTVSGGVSGYPYTIEWDWGDNTNTSGFFPQTHHYEDITQNYIVEVTALYNNGYNNNQPAQSSVLVRYVEVSEDNFIELPAITEVTIPETMIPLETVPGFGLPAGLTFFDDSFFTIYNRSVIEYILSVCADIEFDFVNGDVFLTNDGFNQVLLRNPNFGGMSSLWFTRPVSFQSGDYGIGSSIQWSSFFHEMGHNVTLNMPAEYFYGGKSDGPANCIYSETMAQIFQHSAAYEILNSCLGDENEYGIPVDLSFEVENSAISAIGIMRSFYEQYINEGMNFCAWNDTGTPSYDETLPTFMTLAYRFCLHAEANIDGEYTESGYRIPLQRMCALLQLWDEELHSLWNQWQDDPEAGIFRSTLMVTAISYGFNQDLREEFSGLNFPIDDAMYEYLISSMNEYILGDIDNNGIVEAYDASLILMYFAGLDPEPFAPLPWEEWRIDCADVDGNDAVEAFDASLVLRYYMGIIDEFPIE